MMLDFFFSGNLFILFLKGKYFVTFENHAYFRESNSTEVYSNIHAFQSIWMQHLTIFFLLTLVGEESIQKYGKIWSTSFTVFVHLIFASQPCFWHLTKMSAENSIKWAVISIKILEWGLQAGVSIPNFLSFGAGQGEEMLLSTTHCSSLAVWVGIVLFLILGQFDFRHWKFWSPS